MNNNNLLKISLIIVVCMFVVLLTLFVSHVQSFSDGEELSVGAVLPTPSARISIDIVPPENTTDLVEENGSQK